MVTTFTKTVGTATRDYSTLTLAEADIGTFTSGTNLVSNDEAVVFNIFDDSVFDEHLIINGQTTDATRNITFQADSSSLHDCTYDSGVVLAPTSNGHGIVIVDSFTVIDGIQIETGNGTSDECVRIQSGIDGCVIKNCLMEAGTGSNCEGVFAGNWAAGTASNPNQVINCAFYGFGRGGIVGRMNSFANDQYWYVINCTFYKCDRAIAYHIEHVNSLFDIVIINCTAGGSVVADFIEIGTPASGTLDTTGSENNYGEDTTNNFPDNTEVNYVDVTIVPSPPPLNFIFEDLTGASLSLLDLRLQGHANNDAQGVGVGQVDSPLVPLVDAAGNERSDLQCDPGWFQKSFALAIGTVTATPLSVPPSINTSRIVTVPAISASTAIVVPDIPSGQDIDVAAISLATSITTPDRVDQTVSVAAVPLATSVVDSDRVDQTVSVSAVGSATAVVVPDIFFDQGIDVAAISLATSIVAPDQVDQTTTTPVVSLSTLIVIPDVYIDQSIDVAAISLATSVVVPDIFFDQGIDVAAISLATSIVAPDRVDQTVDVSAVSFSTSISAPTVFFGQTISVSAISLATSIVAPDRVDQTVQAPAISAALLIVTPLITVDQSVSVAAIAIALSILAPSPGEALVGGNQDILVQQGAVDILVQAGVIDVAVQLAAADVLVQSSSLDVEVETLNADVSVEQGSGSVSI